MDNKELNQYETDIDVQKIFSIDDLPEDVMQKIKEFAYAKYEVGYKDGFLAGSEYGYENALKDFT